MPAMRTDGADFKVSLRTRDGGPLVGESGVKLSEANKVRLHDLAKAIDILYQAARKQGWTLDRLEPLSEQCISLLITEARLCGRPEPVLKTAKGFKYSTLGVVSDAHVEGAAKRVAEYRDAVLPGAKLKGVPAPDR